MSTLVRHLRRALTPPRTLAFTRAGTFLILMTFGLGFAAINTGNNLLFLLLGMTLSVIVASGVLSEAVLRNLRAERELPDGTYAGRPAPGHFTIENPNPWPSLSVEVAEMNAICTVGPRAGTELEARRVPWWKFWKRRTPESDDETDSESQQSIASAYGVRIEANSRRQFDAHYLFPARGVYRLEGLDLVTRFPFSLFEKRRPLRHQVIHTVFPEPREPGDWAPRIRSAFGERSADEAGRGDEYFALREYRPGEDKRGIHWKRSASRGDLVVKEHERRTSRSVQFYLVNAAPTGDGEMRERFERGLERLAGLLQAMTASGWSLGLETLDRSVDAPDADVTSMMRILAETNLHDELPTDGFDFDLDDERVDVLIALPSVAERIDGEWAAILAMGDDSIDNPIPEGRSS